MEEELKNEEVEEAKNEAEFVEAEEPTELEKAISAAEDYKRKWYSVSAEYDEGVAEAIMNFPCEQGEAPNTVKQVLKKGYRTKDKVIRFAQVTVTI